LVNVGGKVANVEDGLSPGQWRVNPQSILEILRPGQYDKIGPYFLIRGSPLIVCIQFTIQ